MGTSLLKPDFGDGTPSLAARRKGAKTHRVARALSLAAHWIRTRLGAIDSQQAPRLLLEFPDRFVNFRSIKEFEFALESRTDFPAARVRELIGLTPVELEAHATKIHQVERHIANIQARAVHHPELIGEYFREIDNKLFSQDHGWREIMHSLARLSPSYDAYKRVALSKYVQYLRARQNIMHSLFVEKTKDDDKADIPAARRTENLAQFAHGDTSIFDMTQINTRLDAHSRDVDGGYAVLTKGETVTLHLDQEHEVELLLAGNRLRLYTGRDFYMVDDHNNTYPLHAGKNLIGRHSVCDVVLESASRAVSRNHLIVQPVSAQEVRLTDLSSHGTEVPARFLHRHRRATD